MHCLAEYPCTPNCISMKYFMRPNQEGVVMHAGILPEYPASHGCIRLPPRNAEIMFRILPPKTPVSVID
jgi:lipoprotein-anchoring transpeptidase ErfK/SrfK